MTRIILGSGSPRRRELLQRMGIDNFSILVPEVAEQFPDGLTPQEIVCHISRQKAEVLSHSVEPTDIVITADTMVFLDQARLGKPRDEAHALEMLTALQGRHHIVCTGVTVRQGDRCVTGAETTEVIFRPATQEELLSYIATGEPMDKAGAYAIQGGAGEMIDRFEGSYENIVGLPGDDVMMYLKTM